MTSLNNLEASLHDTKNSLEEVNTQLKKILGWEEKYRQNSNFKPKSPPLLGKLARRDSASHGTWDKYTNKRRADDVFMKNDFPKEKRFKHYVPPKGRPINMLNDSEIFRVSEKPHRDNKDDDVTIQRNRRMFGNIMTTLKQFQMTEVQNSTSNKEQRRREIAQKQERENQEERQASANEKKELIKNKQQIKNQILCFEEKIEIEKMNTIWDNHTDKLSHFIKTKSRPHIFYLPKRHNKSTQHLLDSSKLQLTAQKQVRRKKFDEIIDAKYRIKKRKEFHTNSKYYESSKI